ncbi:MAG: AsmA family protein [Magnetococcales bacterium]|nr:AsmA family protein [Magnetococcales bacterium]
MKALIKIILGVVLLLVIVIVAVPLFVDPNDYKPEISALVKEQTGRDLVIDGDISLSLFPWIGFSLGRVSLSNAPGFGGAPMAAIQSADVQVKVMPLLDKRVEVNHLTLKGLALVLGKDAQGKTNWADMTAKSDESSQATTEAATTGKQDGAAPALAGLTLGGVEFTEAQVDWQDKQSGQSILLESLNLTTGSLAVGQPADLEFKVHLTDRQSGLAAQLAATTRLHADLAAQRYRLENTQLTLDGKGGPMPPNGMTLGLNADISADLVADMATVKGLVLNVVELVEVVGDVNVSALTANPLVQGKISLKPFDPKAVLTRLGQAVPETTDPSALTKVAFETRLKAGTTFAELSDLVLSLDQTRFSGEIKVLDFAKQSVRFTVSGDSLDLDRYLPPSSQQPAESAENKKEKQRNKTSDATGDEPLNLPVEMLRTLDVVGDIALKALKAANGHFANLKIGLKAKDGLLQLVPFQADLYDGTTTTKASLDVRRKTPGMAVESRLKGVKLGGLLMDMQQLDTLDGVGEFSINTTTSGNSVNQLKRGLDGHAKFLFKDGVVKGFDLVHEIRKAYATIKGQPFETPTGDPVTPFAAMSGSAKIVNGIVTNKDFVIESPVLQAKGSGKVNLPDSYVDYLLTADLLSALQDIDDKTIRSLKGLTVPVRVKGSFDAPAASVDAEKLIASFAKTQAKNRLQEKLGEKLKEKGLGDKIPGDALKLLDKLF